MTLLEAKESQVMEVLALTGGRAFLERMHGFGVFTGKRVRVVTTAPFDGPLLVEDVESGGRIMIGRGMARKISVRAVQDGQ